MLLTPAQMKPKSFESRRNSFFLFFFTRGGCASCLCACFGARLLPLSYRYPNISEGADRVAGQLRGDKECPFCGVTKSGRVWRKVPESGARSVGSTLLHKKTKSLQLVPLPAIGRFGQVGKGLRPTKRTHHTGSNPLRLI